MKQEVLFEQQTERCCSNKNVLENESLHCLHLNKAKTIICSAILNFKLLDLA